MFFSKAYSNRLNKRYSYNGENTMKSFTYTLVVLGSALSFAYADNSTDATPESADSAVPAIAVEEVAVEEVPAAKAADQTAEAGSETPVTNN
jgi:hypothetical protein